MPSRSNSSAGASTAAISLASLSPCAAFFCAAGTRFSRLSRSDSISSVSTVSASDTGSILLSTCWMSSFSKQRSTWTIASTSRMLPRNWLPRPFALGSAAHQAGDIDKAQLGRDDLLAAGNPRQLIEPGIGHADIADVRLDRAERIVRRLRRLRLGQRIEQGGLADIGQSDDTAFETHRRQSVLEPENEARAPSRCICEGKEAATHYGMAGPREAGMMAPRSSPGKLASSMNRALLSMKC